MSNPALDRLRALIAKRDIETRSEDDGKLLGVPPPGVSAPSALAMATSPDKIIYNHRQAEFINLGKSGKCCALIGPAGTGKTTCTKGLIFSLIQSDRIPKLEILKHSYLINGTPGIVCTSFTNKAVQNTKRVLPADLRHNCITLHKLLEYVPEYFEVYDEKAGKYKKTMRFVPSRNERNPLPATLKVIIIDEASMVPIDLWNNLVRALPYDTDIQIILIFDIQQLPPVFGRSIAIHALQAGIPRVELTEVYRQALESPIISLAHTVLRGEIVPAPKLPDWNIDKLESGNGKLTMQPWKKPLGADAAMVVMGKFLPELIDAGKYSPVDDVILTPFNKAFGTIEINKIIATHLAHNYNPDKEPVWEIVAGLSKKYFRVGDKVLHNKTEHFITKIEKNPSYFGSPFKKESVTLDYDGIEHDPTVLSNLASMLLDDSTDSISSVDNFLDAMAGDIDREDLVKAASHKITVYSEEFDCEETLDTAGGLNALELGYAITVHKSQGSEYRRVFFITHESQSNMLFRELVYTAITRAREELHIICPPSLFVKGVTSQRLPGKTLEDKVEAFERYIKMARVTEEETPLGLYRFKYDEE